MPSHAIYHCGCHADQFRSPQWPVLSDGRHCPSFCAPAASLNPTTCLLRSDLLVENRELARLQITHWCSTGNAMHTGRAADCLRALVTSIPSCQMHSNTCTCFPWDVHGIYGILAMILSKLGSCNCHMSVCLCMFASAYHAPCQQCMYASCGPITHTTSLTNVV